MGFDGLPVYIVDHLRSIASREGFAEGYDVRHEAGSKVGDGFMATMLSVTLVGDRRKDATAELERDELALICKLQPSNAARQESFSSERVFRREVHMYKSVLPALVEFQARHGVPDAVAFSSFPKCYAAFHEDGNSESVIIMQDLRQSGYAMWDKRKPTQYESVRLLMEQIGRFHGLSLAVRDQNPKLFQEFEDMKPILLEICSTPGVVAMFKSSITKLVSLLDCPEDVEAVERIGKDWTEIFKGGVDADLLGNFGVINHGDCWNNNMMFAMDKSVVLLDWQMSRITSPAVDLSYYLFTSTVKSLRDAHLDDLLNVYYTNLADIVRATGSDPDVLFPKAELHRQLAKFGKYGVVMAPILIPVILADSSDISDLDDLAEAMAKNGEESAGLANITGNKEQEYVQRMKDVLCDARRYGWL